jgi:hypothetical protein
MKKYTLITVGFCFAVFLFCCKTYQSKISPQNNEVTDNEVSAYLHSADGIMHDAPVPETNAGAGESRSVTKAEVKKELRRSAHEKKPDAIDDPQLSKKEQQKILKDILKKQTGDDGDGVGIAIGLIILYLVLAALVIIGLIYLIAAAANNASNSSSNGGGSGSNSNSGGSGSGNGGGGGSGSNSGCYVATMVYGDYDAPEVMVLRKFRDETLARSKAGRAFIKWYYGWSPGFVAKYNHLAWLHKFIKLILDRFVKFLS